jgi:hypothetical protein
MGWDGAGGYSRQHNFSADASAGIKILALRMDQELDDIASAIPIAVARNGQNVPTANLPMGGFRHVNVGAPTSVNNYLRAREFIENVPIFMQDAETSADRISVSAQYFTSVSSNQAPADGTRILVRAGSNKSSAVLYLNGHSANIEFQDGNRAAESLVSGGIYEFLYSSVDVAWKVTDPDKGRTSDETSAGVTPTNYQYEPGSPTPRAASRYSASEQLRDATDLKAVFGSRRSKPTGFSYVTGNVLQCYGPGQAVHDFDAEQEFLATYGTQGGSNEFWVDPVNGSDSNTGALNDPFQTIRGVFQNASGLGVVWLMPGEYTVRFDVRASDNTVSAGTLARAVRIKAWAGPGTVIFRGAGDQGGDMTWTQTPAASTYDATPSGSETAVHIIFHEDNRDVQIQWYSSAANANAVASGWFQDGTTKKIYIRHQDIDFSLPGNADRLEIVYSPATNHLCFGATIYLEGVTFRGGNQFDVLYESSGGTDFRPVFFARHCKWQYLGYHNLASSGGLTLLQDCISEYSLGGDGFNYTDSNSPAQKCEAIEIDCIGRYNGVQEYSLFDGDRNKQGSSIHQTSVILRVNGNYYGNYGQNIADTGASARAWMVGTICDSPYADLAPGGIGGYYNLWTEGTCHLDNVRAGGRAATYGLWVENGTTHLFRCEFHGTTSPIGVNTGVTGIFNPTA